MADSLGFSVAPNEIERVALMFAQENSELRSKLAKTIDKLTDTTDKLNKARTELANLGYDVSEYEVNTDEALFEIGEMVSSNDEAIMDVAELAGGNDEAIMDLADYASSLEERIAALEGGN